MTILYYSPNTKMVTADAARRLGLGYAFESGGPACLEAHKGPDGGHGCIFVFPDAAGDHPPIHVTDRHEWIQLPGSGVYVGVDPDQLPTPESLARREQIDGHFVTLGDGCEWLVPVARMISGATPLPRRLAWDGTEWTPGDVMPKYRELFGAACRLWEVLSGGDAAELTLSTECDIAATALAINYRIGPAEISLMGLFSTQTEANIAKALIDWPALMELKKKLDAGELSSEPGCEG